MTSSTRRRFIGRAAAGALLATVPWVHASAPAPRVAVIGGGFGGATCARYLRLLDPSLAVTLVEREPSIVTCPFSNAVIAGLGELAGITHTLDGLRASGIDVRHASVIGVDAERRELRLAGGTRLAYDRLVVAPGIELRLDAIEGYDAAAVEHMPHAWQAGTQTLRLRRQLEAMADGGLVIVSAPGEPYRCPPGPYERASLIAHYLARHKPRSKLLLLDAKDGFSKQRLFSAAWAERYPGLIEWVAGSDGGLVEAVDAASRTLVTESGFGEHRGDVVNFIPPQRAGRIAQQAGLTDATGWCPVDSRSFASTRVADVHVLGDAAIADAMPKSGFAANSQAKLCAAAIVAELRGMEPPEPSLANTCYSLVAPDYGISIAAVYRVRDGQAVAVEGAGGVSPVDADAAFRAREADYARSWYRTISADTWGGVRGTELGGG
ncbi:MAG: FCSD flavin-binding domain-containing protein, partial [Gammaproteobacteria bacterium]